MGGKPVDDLVLNPAEVDEKTGTAMEENSGRAVEEEPIEASEGKPVQEIEEKEMQPKQTVVLVGVSQSTKGYPHPSQSSAHALDWTLQKLIHPSCKSEFKLFILHVEVPDEDGLDELDSLYATAADFEEAREKHVRKGSQLLQFFCKKCHEAGVPVEGLLKLGDPKEVICNEVLRLKPDLLILGSRGLGPLQRIFVGGVSSYCAKKVECPILVIKRRPEDMPEDASED